MTDEEDPAEPWTDEDFDRACMEAVRDLRLNKGGRPVLFHATTRAAAQRIIEVRAD
ncbi:hypothetical protein QTI66_38380 [Variovorax sp. J22R133]|uniref:hypothetical protein n=1 Tax=Variovorax brevis TaxID=3053503 RepID=UPI002574C0AA|nr:hypothetical protein [Variovorax sp. J22R133]MDM0117958.1 hypothetical protein [Variovorax sp. J22R133]